MGTASNVGRKQSPDFYRLKGGQIRPVYPLGPANTSS